MKIEDKRHKCFFHELRQGEVFMNCYGAVFMKTNDVEVRIGEEGDVCPYLTFNAVFLESGELAHFIDEDEVRPINARVLLEDREDDEVRQMTRKEEEAIKGLKALRKEFSGYKPNEDMFDMAIQALSNCIFEDGTLKVNVRDASEVKRVLVWGDESGGLYYPDDANHHIADRSNGEWIAVDDDMEHMKYMCSECGKMMYTNSEYIKEHRYCFSCGADMRGDNNNYGK